MIPTIAIQEFYDELDSLMKSQSDEWQARPADQKELLVSRSDFDYYVKIRQQYQPSSALEIDNEGVPVVSFCGIRVKLLSTNYPIS